MFNTIITFATILTTTFTPNTVKTELGYFNGDNSYNTLNGVYYYFNNEEYYTEKGIITFDCNKEIIDRYTKINITIDTKGTNDTNDDKVVKIEKA